MDTNILAAHQQRLLKAITSLSTGPSTLASADQRDCLLSRSLEIILTVSNTEYERAQLVDALISATQASKEQVSSVIILETLDHFNSLQVDQQQDFQAGLREGKRWKSGGTTAVLVAATIGRGKLTQENREEAVQEIKDWLVGSEGA